MSRTKYAFELLANMFVFAFGCWLIFMFLRTMDGTVMWGEPNPWILGFEIGLTMVMVGIGIERWIDDVRHLYGWHCAIEIALDTLLIGGGGLMLGNFIEMTQGGVAWEAMPPALLYSNLVVAGLIIAIALERLFEDAMKD